MRRIHCFAYSFLKEEGTLFIIIKIVRLDGYRAESNEVMSVCVLALHESVSVCFEKIREKRDPKD
jgi:hypothetical protein